MPNFSLAPINAITANFQLNKMWNEFPGGAQGQSKEHGIEKGWFSFPKFALWSVCDELFPFIVVSGIFNKQHTTKKSFLLSLQEEWRTSSCGDEVEYGMLLRKVNSPSAWYDYNPYNYLFHIRLSAPLKQEWYLPCSLLYVVLRV